MPRTSVTCPTSRQSVSSEKEEDEYTQSSDESMDEYEQGQLIDMENKMRIFDRDDYNQYPDSFLINFILNKIGQEKARSLTLKEIEKLVKRKIVKYLKFVNDCGKDKRLSEIYKCFTNIKQTIGAPTSESAILDSAIKQTWHVFQDQVRQRVGQWTSTITDYLSIDSEDNSDNASSGDNNDDDVDNNDNGEQ